MICVSLAEESVHACLRVIEEHRFVEIRMDRMTLDLDDVRRLFSADATLIATFRPGSRPEGERKLFLMEAIDRGAAYVDVELESEAAYREEIIGRARSRGCGVIVSFHDVDKTPGKQELEAIIDSCFHAGADIAKIACTVHSSRDNARLLALLDSERKIVVVGMGKRGEITRSVAPLLGSPFTFASLRKGKETAEGQLDLDRLRRLMEFYGEGNE